ncbi:Protein of unknown function [Cotesia congregata]|uniref:Late endosomal/lysosomal adaptor and MAPK and MTOR activator 1 n=1 Tax=Cotesia congregata TaxID=51543 RepID=A0A8J2MQY0_COTCN|nr:Protein of unknown function [Cotesia congregata]
MSDSCWEKLLSTMGCCCSLFNKDSGPQGGEANERTHLLVDPVSNSTNIPHAHSDDYVNQYAIYSKRIETGGVKIPQTTCCLLNDIPAPERILSSEPITTEDQELIKTMVRSAVEALNDVKVEHKEDLVVPFLS